MVLGMQTCLNISVFPQTIPIALLNPYSLFVFSIAQNMVLCCLEFFPLPCKYICNRKLYTDASTFSSQIQCIRFVLYANKPRMKHVISSNSKFYFQQNTTMEQYQEKENTL